MNRILFLFSFATLITLSSCGQTSSHAPAAPQAKPSASVPKDLTRYSQATFAAGCFWHEEALFESIKGVEEAISGYAGGNTKKPTYEDVETGNTGHTETVNIYYDSSKISYPKLVEIYFESMEDPTQVNGQGPDEGTQYRSVIFYRNNTEKAIADAYIGGLNRSGKYHKPIAAQVMPYTVFWKAEDYHQDYVRHNPDNPYVRNVSIRDVAAYQSRHPELIKSGGFVR